MPYRHPVQLRIRWVRVAVLVLLLATMAAVLSGRLPASSSSTGTPSSTPTPSAPGLGADAHRRPRRPAVAPAADSLGEAGGAIPPGTSVFATDVPGVARLDPALLGALRRAAGDAGIPFVVDSGWRSAAYQERLLQQAIAQYGSRAEAARWVATPKTSQHVKGDAVDLGSAAAGWLSQHGAAYGLCQIYDNEPWHFELRPRAASSGCPARYADPTHDPRMWQ